MLIPIIFLMFELYKCIFDATSQLATHSHHMHEVCSASWVIVCIWMALPYSLARPNWIVFLIPLRISRWKLVSSLSLIQVCICDLAWENRAYLHIKFDHFLYFEVSWICVWTQLTSESCVNGETNNRRRNIYNLQN